jgi:hypothetical protein
VGNNQKRDTTAGCPLSFYGKFSGIFDVGLCFLGAGVLAALHAFRIWVATDGYSVAFVYGAKKFKVTSKTVGIARQQLHFLCSDKENEAKETLSPSGGHVLCAVSLAASQSSCEMKQSTYLPFGPEALEVLSRSATFST